MKTFISLAVITVLLASCATPQPNAEFVKSVNFSPLETFSYKHTLVTGLDFRDSDELLLQKLSESALRAALAERGFDAVETGADIYVVAKWNKAVSSQPSPFDSIDGPEDSLGRRDHPGYQFNSRLHLAVEIYETETHSLFWRAELPNVFDATQLTEARVVDSLERAIQNFPHRVEKDPNLPSIE